MCSCKYIFIQLLLQNMLSKYRGLLKANSAILYDQNYFSSIIGRLNCMKKTIHITLSHLYAFGHKTWNLIQEDFIFDSLKANKVLAKNRCISTNKVLNMMLFLGFSSIVM
jgi:hypothetical protein